MLRFVILAAIVQCTISQQYQQKVAPGVPPQNYQANNYQNAPPPPPPQQQQYQQQQYQQQQQQYQQVPVQQQQVPIQQQQVPLQQQQIPVQQQQQHGGHAGDQLLNTVNIAQEREHIQEHMEVPIDTSKMSEQELQFHYFKMHDSDKNNKLDGCELIKSLIHWHDEAHTHEFAHAHEADDGRIFSDEILAENVDAMLEKTDLNKDGFMDYAEFVRSMERDVRRSRRDL